MLKGLNNLCQIYLLHILKKSMFFVRLWASSLTSGNGEEGFEQNSTMSVFSITVTLTEEGMDHVNEVCELSNLLTLKMKNCFA